MRKDGKPSVARAKNIGFTPTADNRKWLEDKKQKGQSYTYLCNVAITQMRERGEQ